MKLIIMNVMKNAFLMSFLLVTFNSQANTDLLKTTQQAKNQQQKAEQQREAEFKANEEKYRLIKEDLINQKIALQNSIDQLTEQFSDNEIQLADKDKQLRLTSGHLGELFGVVRQIAKEFHNEQVDRVASIGQSTQMSHIADIIEAKTLPSREQIHALWQVFTEQIKISTQITKIESPYINHQGIKESKQVIRLGAFALLDEQGYLKWSNSEQVANHYLVQPEPLPSSDQLSVNQQLLSIDPSNGTLIEQLALKPTLRERFEQGGIIGKVILGFLILGLLLGISQGLFLFYSKLKINAQLNNKEKIGNNALGRVLGVYKYDQSPNFEALELRLYEIILDEQQKLIRGLPMLKLLAAPFAYVRSIRDSDRHD
ncbi:flagellar motor protein MotA [Psychromonas sp. KJ10-10]|uniref:flagellar motor protein MotA n=1 Tax=Psychromonas sp. KJ10-10 TaxID=3391823 RepID=UPI0039B3CCC1